MQRHGGARHSVLTVCEGTVRDGQLLARSEEHDATTGSFDSADGSLARRIRSAQHDNAVTSYTGVAVFLVGLKNGILTTFAVTFCRTASTVISICSFEPICECTVSTLASAIIFFNTGDHVVVVALPTCFSPR